MKSATHVKDNTQALKKKNTDLQEIQKQLQADEDELTKMYEKWLDDDGKKMAVTKTQITDLKSKIDAVMRSQDVHGDLLVEKEDVLNQKEDVLTVRASIRAIYLLLWPLLP